MLHVAWQVANGTAGMTFKGCSGHFQVHQRACQIQDTMKILHYQSKYKVHNRQKDQSRDTVQVSSNIPVIKKRSR